MTISFHRCARWKTPLIGALALLMCAAVPPAAAKVFRFLGPSKVPELNDGRFGWDSAYKTRMTVNGQPSDVRIYSARYSTPVLDQLKTRFEELGAEVELLQGPGGATGKAVWPDGKEARVLVLSPESEPRHLMFVFYPEPGAKPAAAQFPVPRYQGGDVEYTVSNDETGTFFAQLSTMADATEVHSFYAASLAAEGWKLIMPALVRDGTISGMAVYEKGKDVCYVQAVNRPGRSNAVTLLVKGGKL